MKDLRELLKGFEGRYAVFQDWRFEYEYPGYFVYYLPDEDIRVYFTPDHSTKNVIDILAVHGSKLEAGEVPFIVRSSENLFQAVRPWLEKYGKTKNPKNWRPRKKSR